MKFLIFTAKGYDQQIHELMFCLLKGILLNSCFGPQLYMLPYVSLRNPQVARNRSCLEIAEVKRSFYKESEVFLEKQVQNLGRRSRETERQIYKKFLTKVPPKSLRPFSLILISSLCTSAFFFLSPKRPTFSGSTQTMSQQPGPPILSLLSHLIKTRTRVSKSLFQIPTRMSLLDKHGSSVNSRDMTLLRGQGCMAHLLPTQRKQAMRTVLQEMESLAGQASVLVCEGCHNCLPQNWMA